MITSAPSPQHTTDRLRRAAARAGVAAAVIGVPSDLYHFTIESRAETSGELLFRLHGIGLVVAFALTLAALGGLVLAQRGSRVGASGALLVLVATAFVVADIGKEAFALPLAPEQLSDPKGVYLAIVVATFASLTTGWLLTAVALRRDGVVSRGQQLLLVAGALLAFPPIPGAYVVLLVGVAVAAQVRVDDRALAAA
jgi:hypothetical protein